MSQHAGLSPERWAKFNRAQQILMIANEMNRASARLRSGDVDGLRRGYERVLRLVDLTVAVTQDAGLLRELLRWRDLVAELFVDPAGAESSHNSILRALLQLSVVSSKQLAHLC